MSENENFTAEQEAEAVVEQNDEVKANTQSKKKFNTLSIIVLVTLALALIMGIVGVCIGWLTIKLPDDSTTYNLTQLFDLNRVNNYQFFKGLNAAAAFAIIAVIMAFGATVLFVLCRLLNVKALKYVAAVSSATLLVSAILALFFTIISTNTDMCKIMKEAQDAEFIPAEGAWLLSILGIVGGVLGIIGAIDNDGAKTKEYFRKQVVALKRKPQKIAFIFLAIVAIYNLLTLTKYSNAIITYAQGVDWIGLLVFVNTLFSILILVAYLNAFPKLKKHNSKVVVTMTEGGVKLHINILMIVVVVLMAAAMIVCEGFYYHIMNATCIEKFGGGITAELKPAARLMQGTLPLSIAHIVLLGVFLLLLFTLPLYRKLIMKINTSVKVDSSASKIEGIDLQDE